MDFSASMSRTTTIITIVVTLLFAVLIGGSIAMAGTEHAFPPVWIGIFLSVAYLLAIAYRPLRYTVSETAVLVHRPFDKVIIRRDSIREIVPVEARQIRFAMRTFGVGGLFGYYGYFSNKSLGGMTWYMTRLDRAVLLRTDKAKILVSPDDVEGFIAAAQPLVVA